jgi:hypothetical protein
MRFDLALLLLAAAAPAPMQLDFPPNVPSIRLSELRDLPDRELVRRVLGPLEPFPYVSHRSARDMSALRGGVNLWFWTRPRAADRAGLCRTDRLIVYFETAPLHVGDRKDPPMVPAGFDLETYYIVENRKEALEIFGPGKRKPYELHAACAKLDPRRDGTPAEYAFQFARALKLVEELGAAARAGRALAPLDCTHLDWNGEPPADEAACLKELGVLGENSVNWVRECPAKRAAPGGCTQVMAHRWFIEFDHDTGGNPIRIVIQAQEDMSQVHY